MKTAVVMNIGWLRGFSLFSLLVFLPSLLTAADEERPFGCRHGGRRHGVVTRRAQENLKDLLKGDRRQMVVLVDFSDCKFQAPEPLAYWKRVFNEERFEEAPYTGSVHDYFYDQSYGQLNLQFDLYHVSLDKKYSMYGINDRNAGTLLITVASELDKRGCTWDYYDWEHDGYIDQVVIVYAGKGRNAGGGTESIWPHQWSLSGQEREPLMVQSNATGYKFLVDKYCCVQELDSQGGYGTFGTICHEYSHCFGLPDFYYDKSVQTVGSWDLMDSGNNNGGGYRPAGYSAHERWLMGWLTPAELDQPAALEGVEALGSHQQAYIIRNNNYPNEYYMVENRQPTRWDAALPGSGVLVFHIDYDEDVWHTMNPNSAEHLRYRIFPANNDSSIAEQAGWSYPQGQNDSLCSNSYPHAYVFHPQADGSSLMRKPLTHIRVADGLASFDFMADRATAILQPRTATATQPSSCQILYRLGAVTIVRDTEGQIHKIIKKPLKCE